MKTVRFSLDMSEELSEKLDVLAEKNHSTKSDLLRRAIALLEVAVDAKSQGKKIGIARKDQTLETEIVGI
ncbi:ribbon-helix-helix protein, CopG family [bacterium]|nr:ribbon-helix-helix protein, CopG family [bacterium]